MRMRELMIAGMAAVLVGGLSGFAGAQEEKAKEPTTLENLQAAYDAAANAKIRYEAFAAKADEEGYKGVAALFRAAATAQEIRVGKHAGLIQKLKGDPKTTAEKATVLSTKENLESALKDATTEKDVTFPAYAKQAEKEKVDFALATLKGASVVSGEHAKLYARALKELDAWKAAGKGFAVCQVCADIMTDTVPAKCPICAAPRSKFTLVK